ncbi:MAG TPA: 16S rRNA (guanine(527)-N(7))-methyltransferase RsmG [Aggregatilineaceae bacterium]|nr:16S rRNA (guanine(527)-N(7))-methyltransferase RsmG [Aggregatilineaceae bacterium]
MPLLRLPQAAHDLLGIDLSPEQQAAFERYQSEMVAWNETRANLTAITEPLGVEMRHFLDSLSVLRVARVREGTRVIDVGTGAGFPGLPLKIVCPAINLTLLEATGKKTAFLEEIVNLLKLRNVRVVNARAEDAGHDPAHREGYDLVLARAVAQMPILVEYLLPLARIGGRCIAMKGEGAAQEAALADKALRMLGGRLSHLTPVELPHVAETHYLVEIEKIVATPPQFPRKPGIPSKKPIE